MKKIILLLIILQSIGLKAQNELLHQWSFTHNNTYNGGSVIPSDLVKDNSNNLFIVGTFSGTADFDKTSAQFLMTAVATDGFLAKYDDSGNLIWIKSFTCTGALTTMRLILHNNIISIAGEYTNIIDFDSSTSGNETTSLGLADIFIAQFQLNGDFIQNKTLGNALADKFSDIKYFNNELILTGNFLDTVDFDFSGAVFSMTSSGLTDVFLVKYSENLNFLTGFKIGGTSSDISTSICIDPVGAISILGRFNGTVDFNPSTTATFNLTNNTTFVNGAGDIFLAKFSNNGTFNTAANIGATGGSAIVKLDSNGDYIIAGIFKYQSDFDPTSGINLVLPTATGSSTLFYSKYSSNLNLMWINKIVGSNSNSTFNDLIVTTDNTIVLTGRISNSFDFDPSPASAILNGPAGFYASYNSVGNLIYAYSGKNISNGKLLNGASQNFYFIGTFVDGVDFDGTTSGENWLFSTGNNCFVGKYNYSGALNYVYRLGNTGFGGTTLRADLDSEGNVFKVGSSCSPMDIDPSAGVFTTGIPDLNDIFISKHSPSGDFLWAKMIKGSPYVYVTRMNTDSVGNIYVIGSFFGTPDFDPSANVHTLTNESEIKNFFLAKYDADGNFLWVHHIGGLVSPWTKILTDSNGNVYFAGTYETSLDFNPANPGIHLLNAIPLSGMNVFYAKFASNGTLLWVKSIESQTVGAHGLNPMGFYIKSNNIYICGELACTADFDPTTTTELVSPQYHMFDSYILKLDLDGNKEWLITLANQDTNVGEPGFVGVSTFGIFVDDSDNIYCTSIGLGTVDYDPTPATNIHTSATFHSSLTKYDANGNLVWLKILEPNNTDGYGVIIRNNFLMAGNNNKFLLVGGFFGDIDFDPSPAVNALQIGTTTRPLFVAQYTTDGNFLSAVRADGNYMSFLNSASMNQNEEFVLSASVSGEADIDFGSGTQLVNDTNFIAKYGIGSLNADEFSNNNTLFVYPNPVQNTLSLYNPSQLSFDINIIDISGKNLFSTVNERSTINVENLSEGVYFIQLINQEKGINKTFKFIKK